MKTKILRLMLATVLGTLPGVLQAQPSAHYVPGIEGIKGASLPPPGWYVRDYSLAYYSTELNSPLGYNTHAPNFKAFTYANVPRLIWISDTKFLGGYVGGDLVFPIIYNSLKVGGYSHDTFGIGDFFAESTLSWHPKRFDLSLGLGVWTPTGDSPTQPAPVPSTRTGQGYWTPMLTAGTTWFIDEQRTWALSALNRYEFNTEQRDTHITPGETYTLEWALSKTLAKIVDVGPVGYYQQQVTANSGASAASRSRVAAAGAEVNLTVPKLMAFISLRYNYEFMAENRAQGHTATLTLTKRF
jgi:hypothetical protein